jgi:anti-anti-sigma regulatory factor
MLGETKYFRVEPLDRTLVIQMDGRLDAGVGSKLNRLIELCGGEGRSVIVDLSRVSSLTASGVAALRGNASQDVAAHDVSYVPDYKLWKAGGVDDMALLSH